MSTRWIMIRRACVPVALVALAAANVSGAASKSRHSRPSASYSASDDDGAIEPDPEDRALGCVFDVNVGGLAYGKLWDFCAHGNGTMSVQRRPGPPVERPVDEELVSTLRKKLDACRLCSRPDGTARMGALTHHISYVSPSGKACRRTIIEQKGRIDRRDVPCFSAIQSFLIAATGSCCDSLPACPKRTP